ncbi:MAG: ABC transporter permease, partial [Candidatus Atribacteria bacterium]|nr:ABC transporter permease [Candidatus Atribacteria bacterium]
MNWKNIKAIFTKEITGAIRDKRTLIAMIIVPLVFYPLLFIGMGYLNQVGSKKSEDAVSMVAVNGAEFALQLSEYLKNQEKINITIQEVDTFAKLKNGEIQAIIEIPSQFDDKIKQG